MQRDVVERQLEESLQKHPTLFLIELKLQPDNQIIIVLDGDRPVSVKDCMEVSRDMESKLDRETEDFSLKVTSAGIATPLQLPRQYKKNIGRKLKIKTGDNRYKATLVDADDNGIRLQWKQREPKPVGKGKHTVQKEAELKYTEIKQAKVMITFN